MENQNVDETLDSGEKDQQEKSEEKNEQEKDKQKKPEEKDEQEKDQKKSKHSKRSSNATEKLNVFRGSLIRLSTRSLFGKVDKEVEKKAIEARLGTQRKDTEQLLERFMDQKHWKKVEIKKVGSESLGWKLAETGFDAVVPGVVVKQLSPCGPVGKTEKIKIGDQIMSINGASLIGMKYSDVLSVVDGVSKGVKIVLEIVEGGGSVEKFTSSQPDNTGTLNAFMNPEYCLTITLQKKPGERMGMVIKPTLSDAVVPSVFIACINSEGAAAVNGKFKVGDQILKINGQSTVGLPYKEILDLAMGCGKGGQVDFDIVRMKEETCHKLSSNNHGIELSEGCIIKLDPEGEAVKEGMKVSMYIMTINGDPYYQTSDSEILKRLKQEDEKTIICMSTAERKNDQGEEKESPLRRITETVTTTITTTTTTIPTQEVSSEDDDECHA